MALSKTTILVVALFMFTPLSMVSQATIYDQNIVQNESDISTGNWLPIHNATINDYPLRDSSSLIHSPFGSFDPHDGNIPLGPEGFIDLHTFSKTGMAIVQSKTPEDTCLLLFIFNKNVY